MLLPRRWLLCLVVPSFIVFSLHSQTPTRDSPDRQVTFQTGVRAVVVDIVVTNGKGQAVLGLHKEDFGVLEDARPQEITFFREYSGVAPAEIKREPMPPNVFSNAPRVETPDSINVLLLDALNTPLHDQSYVHRELVKWVGTIRPGAPIAIFTLAPQLRLVQRFTTDPAVLLAALKDRKSNAEPHASPLLLSGAEINLDRQLIGIMKEGNATPGSIDAMRQLQAETDSARTGERVSATLRALQQLARYLAEFPGRKNVIWFSSAFPLNVLADPSLKEPDAVAQQHQEELQKTADLLTKAQVAIYPVDAGGASIDSFYEAGEGLVGVANAPDATQYQARELQTASVQRNANHATMDELAQDSGGEAFYNTNALDDALARAIHDGACYYRLDYTPTNKNTDGRFRRIQVKLLRGNNKLTYRRGYYADSGLSAHPVDPRVAGDPLQSHMQPGMPNISQILYQMELLPSDPQLDPKAATAGDHEKPKAPPTRIEVRLAVRESNLKFEAGADGIRIGNVEVMLIAFDHYGNSTNWLAKTFSLALSPSDYAAFLQSGLVLNLAIEAPRDSAYLRSGIYDSLSRKVGTLEVPLSGRKEAEVSYQTPALPTEN